uniref:Uncharacterized protein n=1 Tax=viral metagenome TaxID=1070528 RepID=A0A6M3KVW6_9ZZZZ
MTVDEIFEQYGIGTKFKNTMVGLSTKEKALQQLLKDKTPTQLEEAIKTAQKAGISLRQIESILDWTENQKLR